MQSSDVRPFLYTKNAQANVSFGRQMQRDALSSVTSTVDEGVAISDGNCSALHIF